MRCRLTCLVRYAVASNRLLPPLFSSLPAAALQCILRCTGRPADVCRLLLPRARAPGQMEADPNMEGMGCRSISSSSPSIKRYPSLSFMGLVQKSRHVQQLLRRRPSLSLSPDWNASPSSSKGWVSHFCSASRIARSVGRCGTGAACMFVPEPARGRRCCKACKSTDQELYRAAWMHACLPASLHTRQCDVKSRSNPTPGHLRNLTSRLS